MARNNKAAGVILIALFSAGLYMALSFPERSSYFPKIICITGILLSLILLVSAFVQGKKADAQRPDALSPKARKMVIIMGGLILLYAIGITALGFAVSSFLFIVVSGVILYPGKITAENKKPLLLIVVTALLVSVLITIIFKRLLYVPLPSGIMI